MHIGCVAILRTLSLSTRSSKKFRVFHLELRVAVMSASLRKIQSMKREERYILSNQEGEFSQVKARKRLIALRRGFLALDFKRPETPCPFVMYVSLSSLMPILATAAGLAVLR